MSLQFKDLDSVKVHYNTFNNTSTEEIKKIVVDATSNDVYLILPIFPLGVKSNPPNPKEAYAMDNDFNHIYKELERAIGKADLTLVKSMDGHFIHPRDDKNTPKENYLLQQSYSIGRLAYTLPKPINNTVMGAYKITDPRAKEVIEKYEESYNKGIIPFYTSSQIAREPTDDPLRVRNFDLMHTTLTDGPAFGKALSKVGAVCRGDVYSCAYKYGAASNEVGEIGINIHGDVIDFRHQEKCPFCVEEALTDLFENNRNINNRNINNDYILNSASKNQMVDEGKNSEVIEPNKDQRQGAPILNAEEITKLIDAQLEKKRKDNEITIPPTEEQKNTETKGNDKKDDPLKDLENHPAFKKVMEVINAQANEIKTLKGEKAVTDTELQSYKQKTHADEIGMTLAEFEHNFHDPDTGKPDPKAFEEAYKYAVGEGIAPEKVKVLLSKFSPFGTKARKTPENLVTQKASTRRGVPKYNAAFEEGSEEEKEKIQHSASEHSAPTGTPTGIKVVDYFVGRSNNLE